jgi:hypothetical protein
MEEMRKIGDYASLTKDNKGCSKSTRAKKWAVRNGRQ